MKPVSGFFVESLHNDTKSGSCGLGQANAAHIATRQHTDMVFNVQLIISCLAAATGGDATRCPPLRC